MNRRRRRLLRLPAALDYLDGAVKLATLRQWIWLRKIDSVRVGHNVCIPQDALDAVIERGTVPALKKR